MKRIAILALFVSFVLVTAYTVITLYDSNLEVGRMWETPAVRPHEEPILVMDPGTVPFEGGEAMLRATNGLYLTSPFKDSDPEIVAAGRTLYFTYCAQCHGKYHDGNGTVGQSFHPLPGDLQGLRVQSMPDGTLFKEISYGVPGGRQPALATTVEVTDRWRIIAYIKSLDLRE